MGFQDMFKAWRGGDLLSKTLDAFVRMVEDGHWMYQQALVALWEEVKVDEYKEKIRARDIEVNKQERAIRKMIVQHLAIAPGTDVNYCLVLFSVVKDAERVGDYCKNVIEVAEFRRGHIDKHPLVSDFKDIQAEIELMFRKVGKTFRDSDEALARELISRGKHIAQECDKIIDTTLLGEGLEVKEAVSFALLARYYKRIGAHLGNIATSVVMPVHKLDFHDEKYMPGPEGKGPDRDTGRFPG